MSISNVSELRTAIASWTDREDLAAARVNEFIALAEFRITRRLRSRGIEGRTTASLVSGQEYYSLPTDFLEARNVQITSSFGASQLKYLTPEQMDQKYPSTSSGVPKSFTIIGDEIQLKPVPSSTNQLEIVYFKRPTALSDASPTNWIITNAPDMLLYASLIEAELYLVNEEKAASWAKVFDVAMEEWNAQDDKGRHSGSVLVSTTDTGNP